MPETQPLGNRQHFVDHAQISLPLICGAMYPCSNPELVAAVSQAGGLGVLQPISLTYVHGYDFREGLRYIRQLTAKPVGMNVLIEQSSPRYLQRMQKWLDIALDEGIRFFVTSLGKPQWVVDRVHAAGGYVYHDITERKWAQKGLDCGVDGLIAVNNRAGGHTGSHSLEELADILKDYKVPLIAAGGISNATQFITALQCGYQGVQMGTRFIATVECSASLAYKNAIINASADDIVLSERLTGVPVSILRTEYIDRIGTKPSKLLGWFLRKENTKHLVRMLFMLKSLKQLKGSLFSNKQNEQYWQAGKSVEGIDKIDSVANIVNDFSDQYRLSERESE